MQCDTLHIKYTVISVSLSHHTLECTVFNFPHPSILLRFLLVYFPNLLLLNHLSFWLWMDNYGIYTLFQMRCSICSSHNEIKGCCEMLWDADLTTQDAEVCCRILTLPHPPTQDAEVCCRMLTPLLPPTQDAEVCCRMLAPPSPTYTGCWGRNTLMRN